MQPPPGRIDARLTVTRFELDRLPQFVMPKDLGLRGVVDLSALVQGPSENIFLVKMTYWLGF